MSVSRREFIVASAALSGALPIGGLESQASPVQGQARRAGDFAFSSASEMVAAIRRGAVSSVELTELTFKRIDAINPKINAVVTLMREEALARAREADAERSRGRYFGPLHGLPLTIKDGIEVKGVRTTAGNPALKDHIPSRDAAVVERFRRAGAILVGMTNVPFMLADWQSFNEIFGQTNNPWDVTRTPGGSTGGGAAAIAAGLGYLTVGSDIAGSIRVPSHFCGIYGHKPTLNLVPTRGHIPPPPNEVGPPNDLNVVGPLARSAADLRLALEVLAGPDDDSAVAYSWKLPAARKTALKDYRFGLVLDDKLCPLSSEVRTVLTDAIAALRKAGATVTEGWPSGFRPQEDIRNYQSLLGAAVGGQLQYSDFVAARGRQIQTRALWREYFRTHDALLLPVGFIPAFPHDHGGSLFTRAFKTPEGQRPYVDMMFWISFATHAGLPATVAPVGLTSGGLPVGLQIVGPYLEDATPIDVAARLEQVTGGFRPPKAIG